MPYEYKVILSYTVKSDLPLDSNQAFALMEKGLDALERARDEGELSGDVMRDEHGDAYGNVPEPASALFEEIK